MKETNGFYWLQSRSGSRVLCHRCADCHAFTQCSPDEPARAFCCGVWKVPPKEARWSKLPVEKHKESHQVRVIREPETFAELSEFN